jgi:hypothetical protein
MVHFVMRSCRMKTLMKCLSTGPVHENAGGILTENGGAIFV